MHCSTTEDEEAAEEEEGKRKESEKEQGTGKEEGKEEKGFRYVTIIPINFFRSIDQSAENPTAFDAAFDGGEVGTFVAPTEEEKKEWMKHINKCMLDKIVIEFDL